MNARAILASAVVLAFSTNSQAAKLVVMAVNSGTSTAAGTRPAIAPPGAKGFLIGIDNTTDPLAPLAFQEMTFSGPNLVQRLAPNSASIAIGALDNPNVQTRSQSLVANAFDPIVGSTFGANDSWWWDQAYTARDPE